MKQQYLKNTSTLKHKEDSCAGCGMCIEVCPHNVFELKGNKVRIANKDNCMECSACVLNCPFNALEVRKGVGCAAAVISGLFTRSEPSCG